MINRVIIHSRGKTMHYPLWSKITLITLCTLFSLSSPAADEAKEKRWAEEIVDSILVGNPEWLTANGKKFLSIYTENSTEKALGGVIVVHGTGVHPNWADVVYPLRTQLPDYGWHTLSIQMPVLPNEAKYADYAPLYDKLSARFDAAVKFFKSKGVENIIIVAHSQGTAMSAYYMANKPEHEIRGFVAVGMSGGYAKDERLNVLKSLAKITIPTFDLYGAGDLEQVLAATKDKMNTAKKAGNQYYTQLEVAGANHFFVGKEDMLVKRVRSWLARYAKGLEIDK